MLSPSTAQGTHSTSVHLGPPQPSLEGHQHRVRGHVVATELVGRHGVPGNTFTSGAAGRLVYASASGKDPLKFGLS
jgi:hypothetical protein